ncbi:MAG: DUF1858 domain-containing protein [Ignavibacteriales bacterium]|jgi:hypothetical protein|nr:MAG: DUF1858 domain-containing protein [Ignavibacteriales bacterium]
MTIKEDIKLDITPKTLVGDLLKNYPQLEDKLIEIAPVFKKLKNPVLRRTVAKVTTLKQASVVGGVSLSLLINELRNATGLDDIEAEEDIFEKIKPKPVWVEENPIIKKYDAREDLENGNHPAAKVTKDILELKENENYLLITPFIPAPLLKIMEDKGFETFTEKEEEELIKTYVRLK